LKARIGFNLCFAAPHPIAPQLLGLDPPRLPTALAAIDAALMGELRVP
jgi:hypothetical protein